MKPATITWAAIAATAVLASAPLAEADPATRGISVAPTVLQSAAVQPHLFRGDLRRLPTVSLPSTGVPGVTHPPRRRTRRATRPPHRGPGRRDPLLALRDTARTAGLTRAFATPSLNFPGQGNSGVVPPDTVGEVGSAYYIQLINAGVGTLMTIYDKTDGSVVAGPTELDSLWTAGGQCAMGRGDPIVLYDHLAARWLLSEFAVSGNHLCVYVSQTDDPVTGGWFNYDFTVPDFPDYPKYAVWPDAYYVSTNESVPALYALDRTRMLAGMPATFQRFTAPPLEGFGFQALLPSDLDGVTPPPLGSPNFFIRHNDDEVHERTNDPTQDFLEIFEFHVDFVAPTNSTVTLAAVIPVAEFESELCGLTSFDCFPQPGTATLLDPLREVVMWRLQYRNFGTHQTLVGNFVTDVDGGAADHGGIRWFELRRTGTGPWSLFQEGTHAPDTDHRWMGSIAMDGSGNIALGYSVSSTTTFPSIRYVGRLDGDPAGTMPTAETTIIAGTGSQTSTTRWGDYSSMNVDPIDDCTFWYTNEYTPANGVWTTRIAAFRFPDPDCVDAPPAVCGDDVIGVGEECDGTATGSCPTGVCDPDCTCEDPVCGNDVIEQGEECDGTATGSCPTGVCDSDCTCEDPVCGNDVVEQGEDCDGSADTACPGFCSPPGEAAECRCTCGDGVCDPAEEDAVSCPVDCGCAAPGVCGFEAGAGCFCDSECIAFDDCCPDACTECGVCPPPCGDGSCDVGEDATTCPADCGCAATDACLDGVAPAGCGCAPDCLTGGTCCPDSCTACGVCLCGNNVQETGEACDGADAGACPTGVCDPDCTCEDPVCGNDLVEEGEACDGTDDTACPDTCFPPTSPFLCQCPSNAPIDHYVLYGATRSHLASLSDRNRFPKNWVVSLDDLTLANAPKQAFPDDPENYRVRRVDGLANPAMKNTEPLLDPDRHYLRYDLKEARQGIGPESPPDSGRFPRATRAPKRQWEVTNQFGNLFVETTKVAGLWLPTGKAEAPGTAPDPGDATHFICYRASPARAPSAQAPAGRFRKDLQHYFADQFDDCALLRDGVTVSFAGTDVEGACLLDLKRPRELCTPVDKSAVVPPRSTAAVIDGSTAVLRDRALLCYQAKLTTRIRSGAAAALGGLAVGDRIRQQRHRARTVRSATEVRTFPGNQFPRPVAVDTKRAEMVCLPTDVVALGAPP